MKKKGTLIILQMLLKWKSLLSTNAYTKAVKHSPLAEGNLILLNEGKKTTNDVWSNKIDDINNFNGVRSTLFHYNNTGEARVYILLFLVTM